MRLSEFHDKHAGDLTGPALMEIRHRQQALKAQMMVPPATGEYHSTRLVPRNDTQRHVSCCRKCTDCPVGSFGSPFCTDAVLQLHCMYSQCTLNDGSMNRQYVLNAQHLWTARSLSHQPDILCEVKACRQTCHFFCIHGLVSACKQTHSD